MIYLYMIDGETKSGRADLSATHWVAKTEHGEYDGSGNTPLEAAMALADLLYKERG